MFLNNLDPGLKIAGVTRRWESMLFALKLFRFLIEPFRNEGLGDDRNIQE